MSAQTIVPSWEEQRGEGLWTSMPATYNTASWTKALRKSTNTTSTGRCTCSHSETVYGKLLQLGTKLEDRNSRVCHFYADLYSYTHVCLLWKCLALPEKHHVAHFIKLRRCGEQPTLYSWIHTHILSQVFIWGGCGLSVPGGGDSGAGGDGAGRGRMETKETAI